MFLIDGYNLLHAVARGRATPEAREQLLSRIAAWCIAGGYTARIVFDPTSGLRRLEARGPLEVRSVAQGRTADEEILSLLAASDDRTAWTVVSNDRAIVKPAEKRQFKVLSCEEFARLLEPPSGAPDKPDSISPERK